MAGQRCCDTRFAFPGGEFMVFYDYASLHQKDPKGERTEDEKAAFGAALSAMGTWYAHALTTTVALDKLPAGWETTAYSDRGWPTFESAVSQLFKESGMNTWTRFVRASVRERQGSLRLSGAACARPRAALRDDARCGLELGHQWKK